MLLEGAPTAAAAAAAAPAAVSYGAAEGARVAAGSPDSAAVTAVSDAAAVIFARMATQIVLVPRKLQQRTPSMRDGLSRELEISQRIYGCHLIQRAGVLLRLEAVTVASAQTILHRFYYRKSLKKFDVRVSMVVGLVMLQLLLLMLYAAAHRVRAASAFGGPYDVMLLACLARSASHHRDWGVVSSFGFWCFALDALWL